MSECVCICMSECVCVCVEGEGLYYYAAGNYVQIIRASIISSKIKKSWYKTIT